MQSEKSSKNLEEGILKLTHQRGMKRPFPLLWGLLALGLFFVFAVVTLIQFSRISDDKIYQARLDTFHSDERAYDVAVKANEDCLTAIDTRETYRSIFAGISDLFRKTGGLPLEFFPFSQEAQRYNEVMAESVINLIEIPVAEKLPERLPGDCPQIPNQKPVRPER